MQSVNSTMTKLKGGRVIEGGTISMRPVQQQDNVLYYEYDGALVPILLVEPFEQLKAVHYNQMVLLGLAILEELQKRP
jgi:hypothetical protein